MSDTRFFGLIGYPLRHSLSQAYFTDKFSREGIDATYEMWEIQPPLSEETLPKGTLGFNVTLPHKTAIIPFLDILDSTAEKIGAVNVVKQYLDAKGNLVRKGYNTDSPGFKKSLLSMPGFDPRKHPRALVLGSGGASKAVIHALESLGIEATVVSRKEGRGKVTYPMLNEEIIKNHRLIINCTPLGTYPDCDVCPNIPYEFIGPEHFCHDLVYNPSETQFMKRCKARGAVVKNGAEMLVNQAELAWGIWNSQ